MSKKIQYKYSRIFNQTGVTLTPREFVKIYEKDKSRIKVSIILPPILGSPGFGSIYTELDSPIYGDAPGTITNAPGNIANVLGTIANARLSSPKEDEVSHYITVAESDFGIDDDFMDSDFNREHEPHSRNLHSKAK